jgi:hypothetical protein
LEVWTLIYAAMGVCVLLGALLSLGVSLIVGTLMAALLVFAGSRSSASRRARAGGLLGFRSNEHGAEVSAPPGDAVDSEPLDLVVLDAV